MAFSSPMCATERSKVEQIVVEFFAKTLHIILESRIPALGGRIDHLGSPQWSSSSGPKSRDRWFNLGLGDCTIALENFQPWRRNLSDPIVIDILLDHSQIVDTETTTHGVGTTVLSSHWAEKKPLLQHDGICTSNMTTTLERWTVQFEERRTSILSSDSALKAASTLKSGTGKNASRIGSWEGKRVQIDAKEEYTGCRLSQKARIGDNASKGETSLPAHAVEVSAVYKRTIIMLRSLYSMCRLLPAYRTFRIWSSQTNCRDFSLSYKVHSAAAPLAGHENRHVSTYDFTPVETAFGRMRVSLQYQLTTTMISSELVPSTLPCVIPDYVDNHATDALKRFTVEPHSLPTGGTILCEGTHTISIPSSLQTSPRFSGEGRPHSWSGKMHQMQAALQPPSSPSYHISRSSSPSNTFHPAAPYISHYSPLSHKQPYLDLPFSLVSPKVSIVNCHPGVSIKASSPVNSDRYFSTPCLPSTSPSPSPSPSPPTLYEGNEPLSMPKPSLSHASVFPMGDLYECTARDVFSPLPTSAIKAGILVRNSSASPKRSGQSSNVFQSRSLESHTHMRTVHGDCGNQGYLSGNIAVGDDADDSEYSCPFAVDDGSGERRNRSGVPEFSINSEGLQLRSSDAAVGALIRIINSASPLWHSSYISTSLESQQLLILDVCPRKTVEDALGELQLFKKMRDLILSQES